MLSPALLYSAAFALLGAADSKPPVEPVEPAKADQRTELNLLGKVDTEKGESRRNENVQFNLIDNNTRKELNSRVGTSATIVQEFLPERNYYGVEFGSSPTTTLHVAAIKTSGLHGALFETHNNSVFSARTFFQVGGVQPAHQNE